MENEICRLGTGTIVSVGGDRRGGTVSEDDCNGSRIGRAGNLNIHNRRISTTISSPLQEGVLCKCPGKTVKSFRRQS